MSPVKSPEELTARDDGKKEEIVVEKNEAEELPPGWTKKLRRRKCGSAKKFDRFYTDPVTGYIFRSLKDAQRYVKTGEIGRLAIKPKNNEILHMEEKSEFSETGESEKKQLVGMNTDSLLASLPLPEPRTRQATRLSEVVVDAPPPSHSPSLLEAKTRQAKRASAVDDNASLPQPNTRRATRLSGIKIDSPPPSPPDTRTSHQAKRARPVSLAVPKQNKKKSEGGKITPSVNQENNENQELHNILPPVTLREHNKEIKTGPATLPPPNDQALPTVVLPINSEKQESHVVNPTVSNPIPQEGSDSSINFSMNNLWTDPCIEFAVKTLTGAIPFGDLNKAENFTQPPLQVPLEELWTDPCMEFAVKTLTGAIPVEEDDNLRPRPASSKSFRAPHDPYFETGQKKQQQDLTFGNGGLQNAGNAVNAQCSRSMFFQ